jgi:hypothetical protein
MDTLTRNGHDQVRNSHPVCHWAPLSAFSFSRQADSLTRLFTHVRFARLLRPSSRSTEGFLEAWRGDAPCPTQKNLFGKAQRFKT